MSITSGTKWCAWMSMTVIRRPPSITRLRAAGACTAPSAPLAKVPPPTSTAAVAPATFLRNCLRFGIALSLISVRRVCGSIIYVSPQDPAHVPACLGRVPRRISSHRAADPPRCLERQLRADLDDASAHDLDRAPPRGAVTGVLVQHRILVEDVVDVEVRLNPRTGVQVDETAEPEIDLLDPLPVHRVVRDQVDRHGLV